MFDPEQTFRAIVAPLLDGMPPERAGHARAIAFDAALHASDRHVALALLRYAHEGSVVVGRDVAAWLGHGARWGARALRRLRASGVLRPARAAAAGVWVNVAGEPMVVGARSPELVPVPVRR